MAKTMNLKSAIFDGITMLQPMDARASLQGQTIEDSAGIDDSISSHDLVVKRGEIQVGFKDQGSALTLMTTKHGLEGSLALVMQDLSAGTTQPVTFANARLREVIMNADHNVVGTHVAIFVARSTDGSGAIAS